MQQFCVSGDDGNQWQAFDLHWMMGQGCVCSLHFEIQLPVDINSELNPIFLSICFFFILVEIKIPKSLRLAFMRLRVDENNASNPNLRKSNNDDDVIIIAYT